ncbi:MAG: class I SAM-dependent methyltransferase [Caldilineaceae bacterium]|nr:class I SAM-dependent methyltransferase [Caldilineaceae bacterium]MBP8108103.1 class I SAM-dependent methyltransferase [Caldilineaceae bacterium]MBP8123095.1 class I SAM-dependent methyltransferase [Caldilineaceae bacterium]MBP9070742.1 class I SAM-dependent methyltransferase [Caldilineaceae bacterium]
MNLEQLKPYLEKPDPFTPGEELFWDDPHISAQMLKTHLDPTSDRASRRPETIDRVVDWLVKTLTLQPGAAVLDLGCGPGLYAARLAQRDLTVTGVDYSRRSIAYAQEFAQENGLEIDYRYQNYLDLADENCFDVAMLIYGDFCPLSPEQRSRLLANIYRALKPGGYFVLDVTTPTHRRKVGSSNGWYLVETGFWKPGPHLVLDEGFAYPEQSIFLDQAIVIDGSGDVSVYRNWFQDFTLETITAELEAGDFVVQSVWNDLVGTPFSEDTEWIGIVATKDEDSI